ncbi:AAA family ATPase [Pseudomonas sp. RP23018S]|uniref:AAA family ATPase n=1 Tax=Pseudomonas sp. RP23018S TaxID=3096037 RepID=UPI002ACA19D2|nr:AAA family ATPase [Pseudomonas sp. RP23018S]MDZ5604169.1 AAA family ATPase [Pseudomonas sp. RP23018S]
MHIKSLRLQNIGRFKSLELSFDQPTGEPAKVVVLVGNNGAGKTSILKSLATSLGWFVARLRSERGSGSSLKVESINNLENVSSVEIEVQGEYPPKSQGSTLRWKLSRARPGSVGGESSNLSGATHLAKRYRDKINLAISSSLPLVAFYPVERSVIDAPLKPRQKLQYPQLSGYEGFSEDSVDFSKFFEWFRDREDQENEISATRVDHRALAESLSTAQAALLNSQRSSNEDYDQAIENFKSLIENVSDLIKKDSEAKNTQHSKLEDNQLNAVRSAIEQFMPGFYIRVKRRPTLQMLVDKGEQTLDILQLSQGEKSLMALVGDIARRLSILNPGLNNPLQGHGVVLVDEIDMHLHPKWQRGVVEQLTRTFPNCQFVLTTHSPLVISDSPNMLVFSLDHGVVSAVTPQYGQDANSVLLDVMDTPIRNAEIENDLNDLFDAIQDGQLDQAREMIAGLEALIPATNMELTKAKLMLRKQELRLEKNH